MGSHSNRERLTEIRAYMTNHHVKYTQAVRALADRVRADMHHPPHIGLYPRSLVMASLPAHDTDEATTTWHRENGVMSLDVTSGITTSDQDGPEFRSSGLPYGINARALIAFITTTLVTTNKAHITLPNTDHELIDSMHLRPADGPDNDNPNKHIRGTTVEQIRTQAKRLLSATFTLTGVPETTPPASHRGADQNRFVVAQSWNLPALDRDSSSTSYIRCSARFVALVRGGVVPVDLDALFAGNLSALGIDLCTWLVYRLAWLTKPVVVPLSRLAAQFDLRTGPDDAIADDGARALAAQLPDVLALYPEAHVELTAQGLTLAPSPLADSFLSLAH